MMSNEIKEVSLPASVDAELAVCAICLAFSDQAVPKVLSARLKPEEFFKQLNGELLGAILALSDQGVEVDELTVYERLQAHEDATVANAWSLEQLMALSTRAETPTVLGHAIKLVQEKFKQRRMLREARVIMEAAGKPGDSFDAVRSAIQGPLTHLGQLSLAESNVTASVEAEDFLQEKRDELAGKVDRVPPERYVHTGIPGLEEKFGPIDAGRNDNNIIVAAPSSRGKSVMLRQIVLENLFAHKDWHIAFFILEGSLHDFLHNSACARSGIPNDIPLNEFMQQAADKGAANAKKAQEKVDWYFRTLDKLHEALDVRLFVFERDAMIDEIEGRALELQAKVGKLNLVVVDYIQQVGSTMTNVNREQQMSEVSGRLQRLQKRLGCPLFNGSQLNEDGKARESRAIFNDATRFWRIDRPNKDGNGNDQSEYGRKQYLQTIEQQKFRNGKTGMTNFNFQTNTGRFWDFGGIPAEKRGRPKKATAEGAAAF